MKKKTTAILLALMILAGCEAAPATASAAIPESTPEVSTPAIPESSPTEESALPEESAPAEEPTPSEESQPEQEVLPLPEETPTPEEETPDPVSSQPESEPEVSTPSQTSAVPTSSYGGFDLKNLYPAYIWENYQPIEEDENSYEVREWEYEEEELQNTSGFLREDDAWAVVQYINEERENHGLNALPVDDDLMELASVRAVELWDLYDHTRPDGTTVGVQRCGENIGRRNSAKEQVNSWMNSEGHRKNNLSERYHHIGAGCYQAANGNLYWVAVFSLD